MMQIKEKQIYIHHKQGHRVPVKIRVVPIKNKSDEVIGAVELFFENRKMKSLEDKINELKNENYSDQLAGINNRKYLEEILFEITARDDIKRDNIAFCFLDIDDFKYINDNYGHLAGDKILLMIARTLKSNLRPADKVFRWGGDEFALILFDLENKNKIRKTLDRLKLLINKSFINHNQKKLNVTMSFGATKIKKMIQ